MALGLNRAPRYRFAPDGDEGRALASCQFRIAPSVEYMDRAFDDAKYGVPSAGPLIWGLCPSMLEPALAPPGRHLLSLNVWHAPYHLREGTWAEERDRFGNRCIDIMDTYMPGLKDSIVERRFWSPVDLERDYGLLEANVIHGDILPGRSFSLRPVPGMSEYRTPVEGLYLCGSGTWPGGFVSGVPGHNASHQVLNDVRDAKRPRRAS